jgi:hypothetical protein
MKDKFIIHSTPKSTTHLLLSILIFVTLAGQSDANSALNTLHTVRPDGLIQLVGDAHITIIHRKKKIVSNMHIKEVTKSLSTTDRIVSSTEL